MGVRRIMFRRDGKLVPSRNIVLTFNTPTLPAVIHAGYLNCAVRPFIPNPLRCFKCQVFGHGQQSCRGKATCARCNVADPDHLSDECTKNPVCANCQGSHPAYSKNCPRWNEEKAIQRVKTLDGISYPEARRKVIPAQPLKTSYAAAVRSVATIATQTDLTCGPQESFVAAMRRCYAPSGPFPATSTPAPSKSTSTSVSPLAPRSSKPGVRYQSPSPVKQASRRTSAKRSDVVPSARQEVPKPGDKLPSAGQKDIHPGDKPRPLSLRVSRSRSTSSRASSYSSASGTGNKSSPDPDMEVVVSEDETF